MVEVELPYEIKLFLFELQQLGLQSFFWLMLAEKIIYSLTFQAMNRIYIEYLIQNDEALY